MKEKKYTREAIFKSRLFSEYQPDFLRAVLPKESYTLTEAKRIVKKYFSKE